MRSAIVAILSFASSVTSHSETMDARFWVWSPATALTAAELAALHSSGVETLYWHIGQLECRAERWSWRSKTPLPATTALHLIPVLRLDSHDREPFSAAAGDSLIEQLRQWIAESRATELQIDYDCPDRLLNSYARILSRIRPLIPHLSTTALAHWIDHPAFAEIARQSDEIVPMFYDLEPDRPNARNEPQPRPLLDPTSFRSAISRWQTCGRPWRVGLPNFSRVTIYNLDGVSRGHIRDWNWNDICFNAALRTVGSVSEAAVFLRATAATSIGSAAIARGESLAVRRPAREAIAEAIRAVRNSDAKGIVYFRLPDQSDPSGWSLRQLKNVNQISAHLILHRQADAFELTNESDSDLAPRFGEGEERGYALEIDAPAPIWREALPGDFWRVASHAHPDAGARAAPIPLATRLTFWFSHLRAGETLRTGLVELAPNARLENLRYRVLSAGEDAAQWRRFE